MREGLIKIFIFAAAAAILGTVFKEPLQEGFSDLYPSRAAQEEKRLIGTMSVVNARIKEVQEMLRAAGFYQGTIDGKMDKRTRNALKKFQKKNHIEATGKVDSKTLAELRRQTMRRASDTAAKEKISYDIRTVQSLLKNAGFYKGQIDGKMGPETVKAIKQFQRSRNLKESGVMNIKTWKELRKLEGKG